MDRIETLGAALIIILLSIQAFCLIRVVKYLKSRSEQKTSERRDFYRRKAYKEMYERCDLKKSREKLWNMISKGE